MRRKSSAAYKTWQITYNSGMEHQSQNRPEPIPADAAEFYTPQPEDPIQKRMGSQAIDAVRAAGWWNYDGERYPQPEN